MQPLLIFHHIAKTAGTSLRDVVRANFHRWEYAAWYGCSADSVGPRYIAMAEYRRASLHCVAGHSAHYLIPVLDRPFHLFTMLRDPVERVMSLYYYNLLQAERAVAGSTLGEPGDGTLAGLALREHGWKLRDIYLQLGADGEHPSELHTLFADYFNGQSRNLLAPHLETDLLGYAPSADVNVIRRLEDLLDRHYTVGVQGDFVRSLGLYARTFGWKRLWAPQLNRSVRPRGQEVDAETLELVRQHHWLDAHIYREYAARVAALEIPRLSRPPVQAQLRSLARRRPRLAIRAPA
jgi:hypothetical protein